jgi:hypothetical protein
MFLEKWYADVVDDDRVSVLYLARLEIGPAVLGYHGRITTDGRASSAVVPGGVELPQQVDGSVVWPRPGSPDGQPWRWSGSQAREITLWRQDRRLLTWNPLVLNGAVSGAGLSPQARGYAEKLTLNFGPWKLGMTRLKWGRFCGQRHSLVWIEWEGRLAMRLALLDGQDRQLHEASRERIGCVGATLHMTQPRPLVQESIAEGALQGLPLPRRLTALQFFRGLETKWFAAGVLELDGEAADSGHVVFEEVVWP